MVIPDIIKGVFTPDKKELEDDLAELRLNAYFDESISKLREKIKLVNTVGERELINAQINDLKVLNEKFNHFVTVRMTKETNKKLSNLFATVSSEIDSSSSLENDIEKIEKLFVDERNNVDDSFDLQGFGMNMRDFVESKINFISWLPETLYEMEDIKNFYHFFTIEYINFLENNPDLKKSHQQLKKLNGLILNEVQLNELLVLTIKKILDKGIMINNNKIVLDVVIKHDGVQTKLKKDLSIIEKKVIITGVKPKPYLDPLSEPTTKEKTEEEPEKKEEVKIKGPKKEIKQKDISIFLDHKEIPTVKTTETQKEKIETIQEKKLNLLYHVFSQSRRKKNKSDNIFSSNDFKGKTNKQKALYRAENYRNYLNNLQKSRTKAIEKAKKLIEDGIITKEYLYENNFILYLELFPLKEELNKEGFELLNGIGFALIDVFLNDIKVIRNKKEGGKVKLTTNYLEKNKKAILSNLNALCSLFVEIESDNGNPKCGNLNGSSAKGLYQFLINDGMPGVEYFDKKNKVRKKKSGHKKGEKEWRKRDQRNTSSYETALNKIVGTIELLQRNEEKNKKEILLLQNLFKKASGKKEITRIKEKLDPGFSPVILNSFEQTILFLINSFQNGKNIKGNSIKDYMGLVILGNTWGVRKLYNIFQHTNPDIRTLELIERSLPLHRIKFKKI